MVAALLNILLKWCKAVMSHVGVAQTSISPRRLLQLFSPDLLRVDAPSVRIVGVPGGSLGRSLLLDR